MSDLLTFYGFGNYLVGGSVLGSKMVFLFATDKETAAKMLAKVVGSEGEVVPRSLRVVSGSTVPPNWLLAAVMESNDADWSSEMPLSDTKALPMHKNEEYLS